MALPHIQLIETADGSQSLLNVELNESYHSVHGAVQESMHVFIHHGLNHYIALNQPESVRILEVGFGSGLNALLSLAETRHGNLSVHYVALEKFPVQEAIISQLHFETPLASSGQNYFEALHAAPWEQDVSVSDHFIIEKRQVDLPALETLGDSQYDIIYFDAFSPARQPEMWSMPVLQKVASAMKLNGLFVTYCAKGQLKRDLKSLGLALETLIGPPGKKEMVRATRV